MSAAFPLLGHRLLCFALIAAHEASNVIGSMVNKSRPPETDARVLELRRQMRIVQEQRENQRVLAYQANERANKAERKLKRTHCEKRGHGAVIQALNTKIHDLRARTVSERALAVDRLETLRTELAEAKAARKHLADLWVRLEGLYNAERGTLSGAQLLARIESNQRCGVELLANMAAVLGLDVSIERGKRVEAWERVLEEVRRLVAARPGSFEARDASDVLFDRLAVLK